MPNDFPTVLGHYAPPARVSPNIMTWVLVFLCLPVLAFCVVFDLIFQVIVRLR